MFIRIGDVTLSGINHSESKIDLVVCWGKRERMFCKIFRNVHFPKVLHCEPSETIKKIRIG
ncbi:hypothetical protein CBM2606_A150099 [Cupriavidus taiwanensis]|nr:hypothetical protein CBM2606_A150099 [Cupriavidus taiwanensis]